MEDGLYLLSDSNPLVDTARTQDDTLDVLSGRSESKEYQTLKNRIKERIEYLKKKEADDIDLNIKLGTEELAKWRKERKDRIDRQTSELLSNSNVEQPSGHTASLDWGKVADYIEKSSYYNTDRQSFHTQKLIELITKKKETQLKL